MPGPAGRNRRGLAAEPKGLAAAKLRRARSRADGLRVDGGRRPARDVPHGSDRGQSATPANDPPAGGQVPGGRLAVSDFPFTSAGLAWPAVHFLGWGWGIAACLAAGIVIGVVVRQSVRPSARRQTLAVVPGIQQALADGRAAMQTAIRRAELEAQRKLEELVEKRERTRQRGSCPLGADPCRVGGTASDENQASSRAVPRPPQGTAGNLSPHLEDAGRETPAPDRTARKTLHRRSGSA